jgi:hypothetical protein
LQIIRNAIIIIIIKEVKGNTYVEEISQACIGKDRAGIWSGTFVLYTSKRVLQQLGYMISINGLYDFANLMPCRLMTRGLAKWQH